MKKNVVRHLETFTYLVYALLGMLLLFVALALQNINSSSVETPEIETVEIGMEKPENWDQIQIGKKLFKNKCGSCHASNMKSKVLGPPLKGVMDRWEGNFENLASWIRNPQAYLETANDEYIENLYKEYNKLPMNPNPDLTDEEIEAILEFIEYKSVP